MSEVKQLDLTHISGRYPDDEILAEATSVWAKVSLLSKFAAIHA